MEFSRIVSHGRGMPPSLEKLGMILNTFVEGP